MTFVLGTASGRSGKERRQLSNHPKCEPFIVIRDVKDRSLFHKIYETIDHEAVNIETVHQTADEAARRLVAIEGTPAIGYWGSVKMEIHGQPVEEELIGYWRMLAREALEYPEEFDHLVHSIKEAVACSGVA